LLGKIISYRSAFAFRSPARALAAGLPSQDHVYKTTDESFRFHNKKFDEIRCKLDSTENPRSFEKYPTHLKGGPEPLEKEIHESLGSKCEDRFSDPFFDWVQNTSLVRFSYLLRLCNFCKAPVTGR